MSATVTLLRKALDLARRSGPLGTLDRAVMLTAGRVSSLHVMHHLVNDPAVSPPPSAPAGVATVIVTPTLRPDFATELDALGLAARLRADRDLHVALARVDGVVAGHLCFYIRPDRSVLVRAGVDVVPALRGRRVANAVNRAMIDFGERAGLQHPVVRSNVQWFNRAALRSHARQGFLVEATTITWVVAGRPVRRWRIPGGWPPLQRGLIGSVDAGARSTRP